MLTAFPPIIRPDSKILILGSFPSAVSLARGQYYAHKQNRFWKILFQYANQPPAEDYVLRTALLADLRIALWDIVDSCRREGSLDSNIRDERIRAIADVIQGTDVRALLFNGNKAAKLYREHIPAIMIHTLPSTSPANAGYTFCRLYSAWESVLSQYLL